jgi:hypothetical protein
VSGVRAADPDEQVVFRGKVVGDVALAFAPVLASDEDVNQALAPAREEPQRGRGADLDVFLIAVVGVDVDVRVGGELVYLAFCLVLGDLGIAGELGQAATVASPSVPLVEHRLGGAEVNVINPGERRPKRLDLAEAPDRVNDDEPWRVRQLGDARGHGLRHPGAIGFAVQLVTVVLQCSGRREARRLAGGHDLGAGPVCAVGPRLGVFLAYAGPKGRALIDRELYLPRSWTGDEARLAAAKVTEGTAFATKPQLLRLMIERAIAAGIPFGWVTADEAYGDNGPLRAFLEEQQVSYVLAVSRDHVITTPAGRRRADALAVTLPGGSLAAGQLRGRRQGTPLVRLGPGRHGQAGDIAADPPFDYQAV